MLVSWVITPDCHFILHHRMPINLLILFTVICGHHLCLVSLDTNIIWLFLMIFPIICGLFLFD
jgi:hypothetical protein